MMGRALFFGLVCASLARADHFDDHGLTALQSVERSSAVKKVEGFTLTELAGLPKVVQGSPQSVLVVARTDDGNWCKLLVRSGGVKRKGSSQPRPFLHIERLV